MEAELSKIQLLFESLLTAGIEYLPRFIGALLLLFFGWKLTNILIHILYKRTHKKEIDSTFSQFMIDLMGWTLKVVIIISAAALMGVQTASFLTILGTAGLAIGLAIQGTLANVAGGMLILMLKPFKINDLIETQEHTGVVKSMQLFTTEIITIKNEVIIIPNAELSNGRIKNYSMLGKVRIDIEIGISYDSDINLAIKALTQMAQNKPSVLKNPKVFVGILSYGDSAINLTVNVWTKPNDYWKTYFDVMNDCKATLDKENIEIPFPQQVVHLKKD